jgi:hypothetical protein
MTAARALSVLVSLVAGLVIAQTVGAGSAPPVTVGLPSPMPIALTGDEFYGNVAGDSLKYVISWKQPADSAELGKVDSTFYRFVSSKGVTFFGSSGLTVPGTALRRTIKGGLADSLKLVKPAVGDSVTFSVTNFQQCRKGDCSLPGSAGWKYRRSFAPAAATPDIQITEF